MRRICTAILFFAFILASCEEDDLPVAPTGQKLDYYVESYDVDGLGFEPQMKVAYEYNNNGRVSRYNVSSYNPDSGSIEELRYFVFLYKDGQVDKISGYLPGKSTPYVDYTYAYLTDGKVSSIIEKNSATGINSQAIFTYDLTGNSVKVAYTFSNGGSFEYEYFGGGGNITSDRTTRGSQLCSDGDYTYDQNINPFNKLGYVDYLLTNVSANNKLTEKVNYVGCAFPSLIPESYIYEYDGNGFPTVVTTNYKSGGTVAKSRKELFYKGIAK